ncbi:uncharacterized protein (DUF2164 family) [Actinokineospora baliensis]|uniref:DddA-like double-stranded DNA deaminase toxin n=1 Tax=Actinokineospora baliensis TaxID=547056 RepID=UPI00195847BF|nr:DddA-like double-stranded DNA deaminase toxin [Actinokineospora baliensis]MBM7770876.1 uncharacterized protein (DUF2164 family) [Actinokineospora baliensis]
MAISDEVRRLRQVRNVLVAHRGWTRGVELKVGEVEAEVHGLLGGAFGQQEIAAAIAGVRAKLDDLRDALVQVVEQLDQAIAHHSRRPGSASTSGSASVPPAPAKPPAPDRGQKRPEVENQHGDRYPEEANPYHDMLQRRVIRGSGMPISGWVQLDGKQTGEITATRSDPWAEESLSRMEELDPRRAAGLAHHVEMKVIVMMVASGSRHGQVIINHAPCGSEVGDLPGCHTSIPRCLPEGRTLTVLGTDRNGDPFKHTYHGKAKW